MRKILPHVLTAIFSIAVSLVIVSVFHPMVERQDAEDPGPSGHVLKTSVTPVPSTRMLNAGTAISINGSSAAPLSADVTIAYTGTTQDAGPSPYCGLTGCTMTGNIDLGGHDLLHTAEITPPTTTSMEIAGDLAASTSADDVYIASTVTRTAGNIFAVQNNGSEAATFDYDGNLTLHDPRAVGVGSITSTGDGEFLANSGYLELLAKPSGTDAVYLGSASAKSSGGLIAIDNNGSLVDEFAYDGTLTVQGTTGTSGITLAGNSSGVIKTNQSNTYLEIQGNRSAADSLIADIILGSTATRSAGDLVWWYNSTTKEGSVGFDGKIGVISGNVQTTVGSTGSASALPALPTGYILFRVNGTVMAVPYYNAS